MLVEICEPAVLAVTFVEPEIVPPSVGHPVARPAVCDLTAVREVESSHQLPQFGDHWQKDRAWAVTIASNSDASKVTSQDGFRGIAHTGRESLSDCGRRRADSRRRRCCEVNGRALALMSGRHAAVIAALQRPQCSALLRMHAPPLPQSRSHLATRHRKHTPVRVLHAAVRKGARQDKHVKGAPLVGRAADLLSAKKKVAMRYDTPHSSG